MTKEQELTDPNSCMSRAHSGEMVFVLLGRDVAAPDTIRMWVALRVSKGKNQITDAQIVEALIFADEMEAEQRKSAASGVA